MSATTKAKAVAVISLMVIGGGYAATTELGGTILRGIFPLSRPAEYGDEGRPGRLRPSWWKDVPTPTPTPTERQRTVTVTMYWGPDAATAIMSWSIGRDGHEEVVGRNESLSSPQVRTGHAADGESALIRLTDPSEPLTTYHCKITVDGRQVVDAPTDRCVYTIH